MTVKQDKDHELWHNYNKEQTPEAFNELYNHMKPVIHSAINRYKMNSGLPGSVFDAEAANQFYKTVNTFDPNRGVQLKTKLFTDLQSVQRIMYKYQNIGRIPENRATKIGPLQGAADYLRASLGREPSDAELADELSWPIKQVTTLKRELRSDLMSSPTLENAYTSFEDSHDERRATEVYYDLNGTEQTVFDYATGRHGKLRMTTPTNRTDWNAIAKKLHLTDNDIRRIRTRIIKLWNRE
jgi:DNA-directed RNA polymerase sigma subunit (sigma70/sigma32)